MAFGADDIQPAGRHHSFLRGSGFGLNPGGQFGAFFVALGRRQIGDLLLDLHIHIAAELNVGAAARHIGGDRHCSRPTCLGDNERFLFVEAGIQNVMIDIVLLEQLGQKFRFFDRHRADQDRLVLDLAFAYLGQDGIVFLVRGPVDLVVLVDPHLVHIGRDIDDFKPVDFGEFAGFRHRRARHAGKLRIEAEIVLESDRGERLVFVLDGDAFLGFERLMQPFGKAPSFHHATSEFIDDDDRVVLDDIIGIALEQRMRAQRLLDVMDQRHIGDVVERLVVQQAHFAENLLDPFGAHFCKSDGALFLVLLEILCDQHRNHLVDRVVGFGRVLGLARDDQGRPCLIDKNIVDLVDDRIVKLALDHLLDAELHIVAQVIEAEFVVRAVGHVAGIGLLAFHIFEAVRDDADCHAEKFVYFAHPVCIARREIVVDRDKMDALAGDRVQIDRKRGDERLAFTGTHFRNPALMQHHAAKQLHIVMPLAEGAFRRLADSGEGLYQHIVEGLAVGVALAEFVGAPAQLVVCQLFGIRLDRIDLADHALKPLNFAIIGAAKNTLRNGL